MARPGRFVSCGPGVAFLLFATACLGSEPDQAARRWPINLQATLGYHYSTGKYGTSERTDMSYIPLTLRAGWRDWSLAATIPYIRIDGSAATVIEGENGPVLSGDADGLGDVLAGLSYLLFPPRDWLPFLELGTRIKFPTADEDEGLGTGEFDYALYAEVSRVFGRVTPFLSVGYRFLGEPSGFDLNDVWLASLGSVYTLSESVDAGLFLYFRQASSPATDAQLEALPFVAWRLTPHWSTSGYVSAGILDGSPDVGVGLQITYAH